MAKSKTTTKAKSPKPADTKPASRAAAASRAARVRAALSGRFRNDLTLGALFAELVASFVFAVLLLGMYANPVMAAVVMLVFVVAFNRISGGHVNPVVTVALWATRQITAMRATGYLVAQVLGAMLALVVMTQFMQNFPGAPDPVTGQEITPKVFALRELAGSWAPFFAEMLGAFVFGIGIAAAKLTRREGLEAGFIIGGSLMLGLFIATNGAITAATPSGQALIAVINPAAAVALEAYNFANWWTVWVFAAAPLIGGAAGAWLYKLMLWDANGSTAKEDQEAKV